MVLNNFKKHSIWRLTGIAFLMLAALAGTALAGRTLAFKANASFPDIETQRIIAVIGAVVITIIDILLVAIYWLKKHTQKMQKSKGKPGKNPF